MILHKDLKCNFQVRNLLNLLHEHTLNLFFDFALCIYRIEKTSATAYYLNLRLGKQSFSSDSLLQPFIHKRTTDRRCYYVHLYQTYNRPKMLLCAFILKRENTLKVTYRMLPIIILSTWHLTHLILCIKVGSLAAACRRIIEEYTIR